VKSQTALFARTPLLPPFRPAIPGRTSGEAESLALRRGRGRGPGPGPGLASGGRAA